MTTSRPRPLPVCAALLLAACATEAPPPGPLPAPPAVVLPRPTDAQPLRLAGARERCLALAAEAAQGWQPTQVEFISDGIAYPVHPGTRRLVGEALPGHCRVNGRIGVADVAGASPAIEFELRLPVMWNGRFLNQGTHDARQPLSEAYGRNTGALGLEDNALARGFAVLASDAGRRSGPSALDPSASGTPNEQALALAASTAKALLARFYDRPPDRSYFVGCADGGREGLMLAQRQPLLFDGIVAVAPTLHEADAALATAWTLQQFMAVAPRARDHQPVLAQAFAAADLFLVANAILARCDALDGARDGFVMDMAGCHFDPATLQCPPGVSKDCLPPARAQALSRAMAGPRDASGQPLYAAWPWDPGIAAPGWRAWTLGEANAGEPADARHLTLTSPALGRDFVSPPDEGLTLMNVDFGRDAPRLRAAREADLAAVEAPLEAFRRRRGKLVLLHGAADPVVSAWATVAYQQRLDAQSRRSDDDGAADQARTFIVPGMNHCAGGPATDRFDGLEAIVKWVEFGLAPDRIEARGSAVLREESRPLCPWPQVARYRGSGSLHDSASYACR